MVCPTCFCHTVEDVTDLAGEEAERTRLWDSCFTLDHSYIHGGSVHASTKARYRQWMTHKLATWIDQFGTLGLRRLRALHRVVPGGDRHHRGGGGDPEGPMQTIDELLEEIDVFRGLSDEHLDLIAGCALNRVFGAGDAAADRERAGEHVLRHPPRHGRARDLRAAARRGDDRDAPRRRRARLVVAVPAAPHDVRRARARRRAHDRLRRRLPAREVRARTRSSATS